MTALGAQHVLCEVISPFPSSCLQRTGSSTDQSPSQVGQTSELWGSAGAGPAPADAALHEAGKYVCAAHRLAGATDLLCIMLPKSIFRLCVILAFQGRRGGVLCPWWSQTVPCPHGERDGQCPLDLAGLSPDARGRHRDCGILRCLGTRSPWQTCSTFTAEKQAQGGPAPAYGQRALCSLWSGLAAHSPSLCCRGKTR